MDPSRPPTKEEALKYDRNAIEQDVARRRQNIKLFQGEIAKEEAAIQWDFQVLAIQDANNKNK